MKRQTIEFLQETEKNIKELQSERENLIQYEEELEDAHDIEDDDERNDAIDEAERNHSQCLDNIEYLEKKISFCFTPEVAEDLVNSLDPETIQKTVQKFETALFDNEKVSVK